MFALILWHLKLPKDNSELLDYISSNANMVARNGLSLLWVSTINATLY